MTLIDTSYAPTVPNAQIQPRTAEPMTGGFAPVSTMLETADGVSVSINDDGSVDIGPLKPEPRKSKGFDENLAEHLSVDALGQIADDILQGIESDIQSRTDFISNYTEGLDLLGLKIERATGNQSQKGSISKVRHPVLLESVVRFQSGARAEMLPAAGPCKAEIAGASSTQDQNDLAHALEADLNDYLTRGAPEYYPDTDRGLFYLGYGGNLFKKVYLCPIRRRPVSEMVSVEDLIVSENASDLDNALRITHQVLMSPPVFKRMQLAGAYIDVDVGPAQSAPDMARQKQAQISGINPQSMRPKDQSRTIYECYTQIDLADYGMDGEKGAPEGLPLPYKITLDKDSRQVLELRRDWKNGDDEYLPRARFVHYGLIPGLGFLNYGYLHLVGNQARALTAIWRLLVDAGMLSNFPGGMKAKGVRMSNNEIQPGPGEWIDVDIGAMDNIQSALMAMPYKDVSPVFMQLAETIGQDAQRLAGVIEMEVGEGRTNAPVGTVMSMIEQQTQVMAAVHKRLHTSQARELRIFKELFAENPECLDKFVRNPSRQWVAEKALADVDIVPASDPNVPAQMHRLMQSTALVMMAAQNPDIYNKYEVHKRVMRSMGISDSDTFLHPPAPMPMPGKPAGPPPDPAKMIEAQAKVAQVQASIKDGERKAATEMVENQQQMQATQAGIQNDAAQRESDERIAVMQQETERMRLEAEIQKDNMEAERLDREQAGLGAQMNIPKSMRKKPRKPKES